ncbi:MAG: hypothetical protein HOW73_33450 [Polyangiaceae bacterium]|nr:hypothetical protein [Polyangiaceae bacterium]
MLARRIVAYAILIVPCTVLTAACGATTEGSRSAPTCTPDQVVVNGQCYNSREMACDAANCRAPNRCEILETAPAQLRCIKP